MYTVGSWFPIMMNLAIVAIVAVAFGGLMIYYKNQYDNQARGGIWADIWLPNGASFFKLVKPTVDGWVKVLKGHYKLSVSRQFCTCGHEESNHVMTRSDSKDRVGRLKCQVQGCGCEAFESARVIPNVRRRAKYPPRPFLGLKFLQADVRTESWYLNNPEPITWPDNRLTITALDSYVHTREMTADQSAAEIAENEARQRVWVDTIKKIPDKMVLYILIGASVLVGVINLVQYLTSKGG